MGKPSCPGAGSTGWRAGLACPRTFVLEFWVMSPSGRVNAGDTRARIVDAADRLFYESGFEATSFADIASVVELSRGNFYHHFKTKDALLDAVIEKRISDTRTMLRDWESQARSPRRRIEMFIEITRRNLGDIALYGCPVGSLVGELAKLGHDAKHVATSLFTLFGDWLTVQFADAGCGVRAREYATHLLVFSQGVAVMSAALDDQGFVDREVDEIMSWLAARLPPTSHEGE